VAEFVVINASGQPTSSKSLLLEQKTRPRGLNHAFSEVEVLGSLDIQLLDKPLPKTEVIIPKLEQLPLPTLLKVAV